jgi:RTX calcium-binding nonapeptide repeat (4 copies)
VVRQAWLMAEVGALLIGFTCLLAVGCSGDTGSQHSGSQDSEVSQSEQTGSERSASQGSESTVAGSQQGGAQDSESTHEVAVHGESIRTIPHYPTYFLLKVEGITYYTRSETSGNILKDNDLGPLFAEVNWQSTSSTTKEQAASNPVPVYAIKGYDTSFRLAARMDDGLRMFEAYFNPKANEASDVLDIGGKVSGISISHWLPYPATPQVGSIDDPEKIERLLRGLMDAPLKPSSPDHFGSIDFYNVPTNTDDYTGTRDLNHYRIDFPLKDGTWAILDYRMDTGRLSRNPHGGLNIPASGIAAPQAFRAAIEEAVKGFVQHIEALKAEELRQKRWCADTRTTNEARRIKLTGVPYTTNDVPGGPWEGVLRGTEEDDKLDGKKGEDEVHGLGGKDIVLGEACDDKISGGPGDDGSTTSRSFLLGGEGHDIIFGGLGNDVMNGDEGDDVLYGGHGNDYLSGSSGKDILDGGDGNDTLLPENDGQRDEVHCGIGRDRVYVGYTADKFDYVDNSCEEKEPAMEP